jgi:hypothetical protein
MNRREFAAAISALAASNPALPAGPPANPAGDECRYLDHPLGCHPAHAQAALALILFELACDRVWSRPGDPFDCPCADCQGARESMLTLAPVAQLFRSLLMSATCASEGDIVAQAPASFAEWRAELARREAATDAIPR